MIKIFKLRFHKPTPQIPSWKLVIGNSFKGFTLVELLIVIAIVSSFSIFFAFTHVRGRQEKARDAVRKHDLKVVESVLLSHFVEKGVYPPDLAVSSETEFASDSLDPWIPGLIPNYLKTLPKDPKQTKSTLMSALKNFVVRIGENITFQKVSAVNGNSFFRVFGGNRYDVGGSVQQTSDGGYVTVGYTSSFGAGGYDLLLTKFDKLGNVVWSKTAGGPRTDTGYSVQQTSDGGFITVGFTDSFGPAGSNIFLVKFDQNGKIVWSKNIAGFPRFVQETSDGGYIVVGQTSVAPSDLLLAKFDRNGNRVWSKAVGGSRNDTGSAVQQTSDGSYIAVGSTNSFRSDSFSDMLLTKFDSSGNLVWSKVISGSKGTSGESVQQTSDGGYIVSGVSSSFGAGATDLFLAKFGSSGNLMWARNIASGSGHGLSVQQTKDDGYIMTGNIFDSKNGGNDLILIKFNNAGNLTWAKTIPTGASVGRGVWQTSDGGYIISGDYFNQQEVPGYYFHLLLLKTDAGGNVLGCEKLVPISPTITSPSPTVTSPALTVITPSTTVSSVNPIVTSPTLPTLTQCETQTPTPAPTPTPTPKGCKDKQNVYCYRVTPDRFSFEFWAQLENPADKDRIDHAASTAICKLVPPSANFNYCVKSP